MWRQHSQKRSFQQLRLEPVSSCRSRRMAVHPVSAGPVDIYFPQKVGMVWQPCVRCSDGHLFCALAVCAHVLPAVLCARVRPQQQVPCLPHGEPSAPPRFQSPRLRCAGQAAPWVHSAAAPVQTCWQEVQAAAFCILLLL